MYRLIRIDWSGGINDRDIGGVSSHGHDFTPHGQILFHSKDDAILEVKNSHYPGRTSITLSRKDVDTPVINFMIKTANILSAPSLVWSE